MFLLAFGELLAMGLWFSATAVTPALTQEWELTGGQVAWLTMSVQLGFVAGALLSALLNLADIWTPKKVVALGAIGGAALNLLIPLTVNDVAPALLLRFLTGMMLAAVYPVGMKIMATWTKEDRGLGLGLLVGALTIGSASPHLIRGLGEISHWQPIMVAGSMLAAIGGVIVWVYGDVGPYGTPAPRFRWSYLGRSMGDRSLRLANLGYLGHMWELYAMWTWIPLFIGTAYAAAPQTAFIRALGVERSAALATFIVIGVGGFGSLLAGKLADTWGRANTTIVSMLVSGTCAVTIGLFIDNHPLIITAIALVWGFFIVADSAQFSSAVSELGEPDYMGTLLTTQTSMGFLLTLVSIRLIPGVVDAIGWRWAFSILALGPVMGCTAMWMLKHSPEAARMAGGRG